jgi:Spy/CpxP family protein refolding chaperone
MKRISTTLTVGALLVLLTMPALAGKHGAGYGPGMGPGMGHGIMMQSLIPQEKQEAFAKLWEAHQAEVDPIQDQMWTKHEELRALAANPNTKPETLQTLVRELTELRSQLRAKGNAFRASVKKELGVDLPYGMGRGYGMGLRMFPAARAQS